ncbi:MAG: preprotein translocase subunit SecG [Porphyromonas sp.]|nr:preprotein translocase subunit SecG [Porphyromonas sp.]
MYIFLTILIVLASLLLILVVVIQNSKGGGLAAGFSSSNQIMGVRKTTDFLEKATWYLAGAVVVLSILSSRFLFSSVEDKTSDLEKQVKQEVVEAEKSEATKPDFKIPAQQTPATPEQQPAQ